MKRIRIDNEELLNLDNIKNAILMTIRYKNSYVKNKHDYLLQNINLYSNEIKNLLENDLFEPSKNEPFTIYEPICGKYRKIDSVPIYPDQVIHNLLINLSKDYMIKSFVPNTCACIPNRGPHYGKRFLQRYCRENKKKYFVKLDIKKYYNSVGKELIIETVDNKFKNCLWKTTLLKILLNYEYLPIGLLTSQWMGNLILDRLDHYIKDDLKIKKFIRYNDDIIIIESNKRKLSKVAKNIKDFTKNNLNLNIKPYYIHRFSYKSGNKYRGKPLDALGFKFYINKTIIRKKVFKRIRLSCLRYNYKKRTLYKARSTISGYGWMKHTNSQKSYMKYMNPIFRDMKRKIRDASRK